MKLSSSLPWKIGLSLVLAGVFALPASYSTLGVRRLEARIDGASRLVSVTALDGEMCALPPPEARPTPGEVIPSPVNPPSGCVFHPRCPMAVAECRRVVPELRDMGNGHSVACIRV